MPSETNALIAIGRNPRTAPLLGALLQALDAFAEYELTPRLGALHIVAEVPFLEVVADEAGLLLRLILSETIASPRVVRVEARPGDRWRHTVRLAEASQVDEELAGWLERAYRLALMTDR